MSIVHLVAQTVKCLPTMRETRVWSLGGEATLAKEMTTHSSTLAWKILWIEEPGRLQYMGSQRVGHDWAISLSLSIYTSLGILWDYHLFCRGSWMQMVSTPCMCMYISVWMGQFLCSHASYTHTHTHIHTLHLFIILNVIPLLISFSMYLFLSWDNPSSQTSPAPSSHTHTSNVFNLPNSSLKSAKLLM